MTEEELRLYNLTQIQKQWIRGKQIKCGCCKCYGVEQCGEHAPELRRIIPKLNKLK